MEQVGEHEQVGAELALAAKVAVRRRDDVGLDGGDDIRTALDVGEPVERDLDLAHLLFLQ